MTRYSSPFAIFSLIPLLVNGFESGFTTCPADVAAVTIPQLDNSVGVTLLSFEEAGYSLVVNDAVILDDLTGQVELVVGGSFRFTVTADNEPFVGALIRIEGVGILDADQNSQRADACSPEAFGVTNTNAEPKEALAGIFIIAGGDSLVLDVTVIASDNDNDGFVYSYKQYVLPLVNLMLQTNAPLAASTVTPTISPVAAPQVSACSAAASK